MNILLWIIFGAIVGWIASTIMSARGGLLFNIVLGIIGALVGGFLFDFLGGAGVTGFNLYSLIVSVIGAIVVIYLGRFFRQTV